MLFPDVRRNGGFVGCVCTVNAFPQTLKDLGKEHLTVHLVRTDVCLLRRQAAAGYQLSEGLREEAAIDLNVI